MCDCEKIVGTFGKSQGLAVGEFAADLDFDSLPWWQSGWSAADWVRTKCVPAVVVWEEVTQLRQKFGPLRPKADKSTVYVECNRFETNSWQFRPTQIRRALQIWRHRNFFLFCFGSELFVTKQQRILSSYQPHLCVHRRGDRKESTAANYENIISANWSYYSNGSLNFSESLPPLITNLERNSSLSWSFFFFSDKFLDKFFISSCARRSPICDSIFVNLFTSCRRSLLICHLSANFFIDVFQLLLWAENCIELLWRASCLRVKRIEAISRKLRSSSNLRTLETDHNLPESSTAFMSNWIKVSVFSLIRPRSSLVRSGSSSVSFALKPADRVSSISSKLLTYVN